VEDIAGGAGGEETIALTTKLNRENSRWEARQPEGGGEKARKHRKSKCKGKKKAGS